MNQTPVVPASRPTWPTPPPDHPPLPPARIGVVLANLGTPDATDYWSMRRYLERVPVRPAGDRLPALDVAAAAAAGHPEQAAVQLGRELPQDLEQGARTRARC